VNCRPRFKWAFCLFLPFLVIDFLVSSVLMALGMMMMPPSVVVAAVQAAAVRAGRWLAPGREEPRGKFPVTTGAGDKTKETL